MKIKCFKLKCEVCGIESTAQVFCNKLDNPGMEEYDITVN
jgi:hypothetical protein